MGDVFITRRGGGAQLFAAIGVEYPSGSKCDCSNGERTLRAADTSGLCVFSIPEAGEWTVRCYDGEDYDSAENKRSQSVEISDGKRYAEVKLLYDFTLLGSNGLADGYSYESLGSAENSVDKTIIIGNSAETRQTVFINPPIDCSNFSKVTVTGMQTDSGGGSGSTLTVGVVKTKELTTDVNDADDVPQFVASAVFDMAKLDTEQELTVDLSKVSGDCYFAVSAYYVAPGEITSVVFS